ncbi:RDD family protein [Methyloligella halotolerans]|uniref:RDD family protein n=1 Tax=Methyloligella halotolerans TaxID=1177755 RepID=A0A1E2S264_9HYPH|nr:RDD family protein [Methyloligella halotolerans]ODA68586.1 RDD family protein [Methyloligella halotolerans]
MSDAQTTAREQGTPFNPAFDVVSHPNLFEGILRRRSVAFIIDAIIIAVLWTVLFVVSTILTLGIALFFVGVLFPIVGLGYNALTVGGPNQSTIGMRMMGVKIKMWHGGSVSPLIGAFHALLFWLSLTIFFPILLWPLIDRQKRCLHDIFAGVVAVRNT